MLKQILKSSLLVVLSLGILSFGLTGCEEIDVATVAKIIKGATSVAFTTILDKNPEFEDTFYAFAQLNKRIMIDREVDAQLATRLMTDVLANFDELDEDAKLIILTLFNTIIPMIDLPEAGVVKEPQKTYLIAFYNGIIQAVETKRAFREDVIPPISWEVWLFMQTLDRLET